MYASLVLQQQHAYEPLMVSPNIQNVYIYGSMFDLLVVYEFDNQFMYENCMNCILTFNFY